MYVDLSLKCCLESQNSCMCTCVCMFFFFLRNSVVPNKGIASETCGRVSATRFRNTVSDSKMVTPETVVAHHAQLFDYRFFFVSTHEDLGFFFFFFLTIFSHSCFNERDLKYRGLLTTLYLFLHSDRKNIHEKTSKIHMLKCTRT